jgi:hypothetical protein
MSNPHDDDDIPTVRPARPARRDDDDYEYEYEQRDIGDDPAMRLLLPVGTSGWAIASGYLGLISVLLIPAPFAVLTGILAIMEMKRNPKKHGMGRAIFGIVMGSLFSIGLLFVAVMMLLEGVRRKGW